MSNTEKWNETLVDKRVTYSVEVNGRFVIVEDVPARVNAETGERYFSPEAVELLQQAVRGQYRPVHVVETPVYAYSAFESDKPLRRS